MRACDHEAEQIGILVEGVKTPSGVYGTKVVQTYPVEGVFPSCGR
jgi:hypothetical protein